MGSPLLSSRIHAGRIRRLCAAAAAAATVLSLAANAGAASADTTTTTSTTSSLLFGIYPGGPAGGATGSNPDNVSQDLAAVKQLDSSGAPFVVHLYAGYYGPGSYTASQEVGSEVQTFAKNGIQVELVLAYRPTDKVASTDVPGFAAWTQSTLSSLGQYLSYVQVTNEANVSGDPSSNDGSFPGVTSALVQGVEAAKSYISAHGESIKVGFNWSYNSSIGSNTFWSSLATTGGATFENDVDWVGVDVYPGTWQTLPTTLSFGDGVSQVMTQAIQSTRSTYMPLAGLPASVPIQITETGYPTGPNRTTASQEAALESEVDTANGLRSTDNVSALEFFDLRDAITNSTVFEDQYGMMTDQWVPKPAFTEYQSLITQLDPVTSTTGSGGSTSGSGSSGSTGGHGTTKPPKQATASVSTSQTTNVSATTTATTTTGVKKTTTATTQRAAKARKTQRERRKHRRRGHKHHAAKTTRVRAGLIA
jgi:hypothetical protein